MIFQPPPPPIVAEDRPAFVRVIVTARATSQEVEATDPRPEDGRAVLSAARDIGAAEATVQGVQVSISGGLVRLRFERLRFKYLAQTATGRRIVIDLYKAAPTVTIRRGRNGCLELTGFARRGGAFVARGRERRLFEHSFFVILRGPDGRVLRGPRAMTGDPWRVLVRTRTAGRRGTWEAVATSARDGALVCLVQVRVKL